MEGEKDKKEGWEDSGGQIWRDVAHSVQEFSLKSASNAISTILPPPANSSSIWGGGKYYTSITSDLNLINAVDWFGEKYLVKYLEGNTSLFKRAGDVSQTINAIC